MARPIVAPQRREQILHGLFAAIAKRGFQRCSITDVAREAGLPRGALHYYFASKDEMLTSLMQSLGRAHLEGLVSYQVRFADPFERLLAVFRYHFLPEDETARERTRVWIEYWGYGMQDPGVRGVIREVQAGIRQTLEQTVHLGVAAGVFRPVDPHQTAILILGLVEGPMLQRTYDHLLVEGRAVIETTRELLAHYLLPRPVPAQVDPPIRTDAAPLRGEESP